ncbi:hypothetical protein GCM10010182_71370 [Actinomadura cremea]|nr:hypothetical protein GCM10010182_71370 [Actinomadura cremea]
MTHPDHLERFAGLPVARVDPEAALPCADVDLDGRQEPDGDRFFIEVSE